MMAAARAGGVASAGAQKIFAASWRLRLINHSTHATSWRSSMSSLTDGVRSSSSAGRTGTGRSSSSGRHSQQRRGPRGPRGGRFGRGSQRGASSSAGASFSPRGKPKPTQVLEDFGLLVKKTQAMRYKVHKPECDCGKIRKLKARLSEKDLERKGFWVLADTGSVNLVFHPGDNLTSSDYQKDPLHHESALYEILRSAETPPVKISGASCMLQDHPNGFLCILSNEIDRVNQARDLARQQMLEQTEPLHSDHADYICTLSFVQLKKLAENSGKNVSARRAVLESLQQQGVPASSNANTRLDLGHHVTSALSLFSDFPNSYLFVLVVQEESGENAVLQIDLPGGKRQLGESSWECAKRETWEEVSLNIDQKWLCEDQPRLGEKHDSCNTFYLAIPPPVLDTVDQLTEDLRSTLQVDDGGISGSKQA